MSLNNNIVAQKGKQMIKQDALPTVLLTKTIYYLYHYYFIISIIDIIIIIIIINIILVIIINDPVDCNLLPIKSRLQNNMERKVLETVHT